jgi:hypothetical protein
MTSAADQFDDTSSPTDLQPFVCMATSLVGLLETAKREFTGNHEAAKASLAKASIILQSETRVVEALTGGKRVGWRAGR